AEIFSALVDTIRRRFGYTLVQIYRLNDEGQLTNEPRSTQALLTFGNYTTIPLESQNALSTALHEARIVRVSHMNPSEKRTHFLPNTRFALAIPLIHQEHILGVLDVQSTTEQPFSENTINALNMLVTEAAA